MIRHECLRQPIFLVSSSYKEEKGYVYISYSSFILMNKKGGWALALGIILIIILVILIFFYFSMYKRPGYDKLYQEQSDAGKIINPVSGLSKEEAISEFNESFVYYLLYSIKAYNLHNPPMSNDEPKIEIIVDDQAYNARIVEGAIIVNGGSIEKKDIVITATKEEAIKMLQDRNYIAQSFSNGKSNIDLIESKSTLFAKGYLSIYHELTGASITGSVIRIYAG